MLGSRYLALVQKAVEPALGDWKSDWWEIVPAMESVLLIDVGGHGVNLAEFSVPQSKHKMVLLNYLQKYKHQSFCSWLVRET